MLVQHLHSETMEVWKRQNTGIEACFPAVLKTDPIVMIHIILHP
jgi:hypothetical protein